MGAQRLCSMMAEAASRSLVTRWGEGHRSFVQAMLLLPDASSASSTEQQVGQGGGGEIEGELLHATMCPVPHHGAAGGPGGGEGQGKREGNSGGVTDDSCTHYVFVTKENVGER